MALHGDVIALTDRSDPVGLLVDCLRQAHGLDISCFSESFLARSFERRWQAAAGMTSSSYLHHLGRDWGEAEAFVQSPNIHHSEFFRDPLVFAMLEHRLLPGLANAKEASDYPEIRVWSAGCAAGEAHDGQEGLAQARRHGPDIILMDIALPEVDGMAALAEIRRDEALRHIAVFAVTASAMTGDREKILAHGFDGYISKPIEHALLLEAQRGAFDA